ncbi:Retrovirus-related Pol polyprotein from transposon RE1 [Sesamum angolense]|uniref:Retrovirus-related Pol polyprotein from transposon RE1 n=1 Tax=Sesamum angolense TaxID=2727404 RepID=A0AAE1WMC2_9LAMI|nr:Retrovirus-related Pol polyprotein from transposon RE1 [Sesamum angolense]
MTWLLNSMEENVSVNDGQFVTDYFASLKGVADEILLYHPLNCDAKARTLNGKSFYWPNFYLASILSSVPLKILYCPMIQFLLYLMPCLGFFAFPVVPHWCHLPLRHPLWLFEVVPEWANALSSESNVSVSESDQVSLSREAYERLIHQPVANSTSSTATPVPLRVFLLLLMVVVGFWSHHSYHCSGIVHPSKDLILDSILFARHFPDLQTKKTIGDGHERDGLYYLDTTTTPVSAHTISATISPFQWHCCLGHPSLAKLEQLLLLESSVSKLEYVSIGIFWISHMNVPKSFWGDVVLTAYFLINCMPSSVLHGDIPYFCLYPNRPLYHVSPRVFDVCVLHITSLMSTPYYSSNKDKNDKTITDRPSLSTPVPLPSSASSLVPIFEHSSRPLLVYVKCRQVPSTTLDDSTHPSSLPAAPPSSLSIEPENDLPIALRKDKAKYTQLVGKLIYLIVTRPDISFAVGIVSQFMDRPRTIHWEAALRILKYVKVTPGKGLLYKKHGHLKIEAYSDADYAGSRNDRRSTSGYCTYLGGNLVTWRSKKQTIVARLVQKLNTGLWLILLVR